MELDGSLYVGSIPNIVAKDMRKMFFARVFVTFTDGTVGYSDIRSFSVEDYAYRKVNNVETTAELKELVNKMIMYGDSASAYFQ